MPRKKSRVKSVKRSELMAARWKDPAKGADGLTYAERMKKRAKDQRDREIAAKAGGATGEGVSTEATQTGAHDAPAAGAPLPPPARPTPASAPKSARRGWTKGRAWR